MEPEREKVLCRSPQLLTHRSPGPLVVARGAGARIQKRGIGRDLAPVEQEQTVRVRAMQRQRRGSGARVKPKGEAQNPPTLVQNPHEQRRADLWPRRPL